MSAEGDANENKDDALSSYLGSISLGDDMGWDIVRSTIIKSIKDLLDEVLVIPIEDFTMEGKIEVASELIILLRLTRQLNRLVNDEDDDDDEEDDD